MRLIILSLALSLVCAQAESPTRNHVRTSDRLVDRATKVVASLANPKKLDRLRSPRAANERTRKACYWLYTSGNPELVLAQSIADTHRGRLAKMALRRNLKILEGLGCLTKENLGRLRKGRSPVITRGPYVGERAEVDHIVPVETHPQYANWFGNLEFLPMTLNRRKGAKINDRVAAHLKLLQAP